MRGLFWLVVISACGGGNKPREVVPEMKDPAWAADYEARATTGCECADAACLDKTHGELLAIETEHGGMDDAPASVHVAHGKFDKCWRDGTKDIERDFEAAAQKICTCTTSDCLRTARIEMATLSDGKYRENLDAELAAHPKATTAAMRAATCIRKVTMPAADAVAAMEHRADSMCGCKDVACAASVEKQPTGMENYLEVDASVDVTKVEAARARYCGCWENAIKEEIKAMTPVPGLTSVRINLDMRCR